MTISATEQPNSLPVKECDFVPKKKRKAYLVPDDLSTRKKVRTIMLDETGLPTGARIDMTTGEVRPHSYKDYSTGMRRPRPNQDLQDLEPFWMRSLPALPAVEVVDSGIPEADKSRKKLTNKAKPLLHDYLHLKEAVADYPVLDHILCGATALDLGGATRGLNRAHVFTLLQHLDVISPSTVRDFAGHSKSHSEKVAVCLRIVSTAFSASIGKGILHMNS